MKQEVAVGGPVPAADRKRTQFYYEHRTHYNTEYGTHHGHSSMAGRFDGGRVDSTVSVCLWSMMMDGVAVSWHRFLDSARLTLGSLPN